MLTKNIRNIRVIFKDKDIKDILITEEMANAIRVSKGWIQIPDPDNFWRILFDWERSLIKRMEDTGIIEKAKEMKYSRWVCDYWTRHPWNDKCDCIKRFWVHHTDFQGFLYDNDLLHAGEWEWYITEQMQEYFLKNKNERKNIY